MSSFEKYVPCEHELMRLEGYRYKGKVVAG